MNSRTLCLISCFTLSTATVFPAPYNITVAPGYNLIANQLDNGANTLNVLMPAPPPDTTVYLFNNAAQTYTAYVFDPDDLAWVPDGNGVLASGVGAYLRNPGGAYVQAFTGGDRVPVLPSTLLQDRFYLLSRQTVGLGTYESIVGLPPEEGAIVYRLIPGQTLPWQSPFPLPVGPGYLFENGRWIPSAPIANVGESVWIRRGSLPSQLSSSSAVKWYQPPDYLATPCDPQMDGGDRASDFDWMTLMQTNSSQTNWVIADDFRSDGRPIRSVRWWGSYLQPWPNGATNANAADGFTLSFFADVPATSNSVSHPGSLLGSYVAPASAVRTLQTPFFGWDNLAIFRYEVSLKDTCLDHAVTNLATPQAFLEQSNVVYWLAIAAEIGLGLTPQTNGAGVVTNWVQFSTGRHITNHFWGWHTGPTNWNDKSVMGRLTMSGTNWVFSSWATNDLLHMELDQAFVLLTNAVTGASGTNAANGTNAGQYAKWSQLPGYKVFTNSPDMRGGDRPSDVDWVTLMTMMTNMYYTNFIQPNWIIADDFRSDGRPIVSVRWWGSYLDVGTNGFEDAFILSFFRDVPASTNNPFSYPGDLLGTYVVPFWAVRSTNTHFIGWDTNAIYQYEADLKSACLDHAVTNLSTPTAFLEVSNTIYWLAITAEVGHGLSTLTDCNGNVTNWIEYPTGKRATNHFWGWHTSGTNWNDVSVMGHLSMPDSNWVYSSWMTNDVYHMELDQAFELLTTLPGPPPCGPRPTVTIVRAGTNVVLSWSAPEYCLQGTPSLRPPVMWTNIAGGSPVTVPITRTNRFFRVCCPCP